MQKAVTTFSIIRITLLMKMRSEADRAAERAKAALLCSSTTRACMLLLLQEAIQKAVRAFSIICEVIADKIQNDIRKAADESKADVTGAVGPEASCK